MTNFTMCIILLDSFSTMTFLPWDQLHFQQIILIRFSYEFEKMIQMSRLSE